MRYDRGVIESFVDLTYRGLSLGRRIRLSQVRPSTGYLELPAAMPVGAHIAIATDDGAAFEATVLGVHEQIAGSDRAPGMIVTPALADDAARAWWQARVTMSDEDPPRMRTVTGAIRSRPVTVRPRSHTDPMRPRATAGADGAAIVADLEARVTAAAGVAPAARGPDVHEMPTVVMSAIDAEAGAAAPAAPARADGDRNEMRTMVMPASELEVLAAASGAADADPATTLPMARAGEPEVVDDGSQTMVMAPVDPAAHPADAADPADPRGADVTDPGGPAGAGGDAAADVTDPGDPGEPDAPPDGDPSAEPPGGRKKRRWWR